MSCFAGTHGFVKKLKKRGWRLPCVCVLLEELALGLQGLFPHLLAILGARPSPGRLTSGCSSTATTAGVTVLPLPDRNGWGWERVTATCGSVLSLGKNRCEHLRQRLGQVRG